MVRSCDFHGIAVEQIIIREYNAIRRRSPGQGLEQNCCDDPALDAKLDQLGESALKGNTIFVNSLRFRKFDARANVHAQNIDK